MSQGTMEKFGTGGKDVWKNGMEKILKEISNLRSDMKGELKSMRGEMETMREQLEEERRTREEERKKRKRRMEAGEE